MDKNLKEMVKMLNIDIFSAIVGAVIWELLCVYFHCYVMPNIKKKKYDKKMKKTNSKTQQAGDYKDTNVGFTSHLNK